MISFYKIEKIVNIWLECIKIGTEILLGPVSFVYKAGGWLYKYSLVLPKEMKQRTNESGRHVYIHAITNTTLDKSTSIKICLDNPDNPVFVITDEGVNWANGTTPTDISVRFYDDSIGKLKYMLIHADETLNDYRKEHPKFDMDESHMITIYEVIFKEDDIEIKFISNNRLFGQNNKLYIGFETIDNDGRESNYVFKVTMKRIPVRYPWSLGKDKHIATPFQEYEYVAKYNGNHLPSEEEIMNATFRWIISDEVINQTGDYTRKLWGNTQ
jgi:hypothetical protein